MFVISDEGFVLDRWLYKSFAELNLSSLYSLVE